MYGIIAIITFAAWLKGMKVGMGQGFIGYFLLASIICLIVHILNSDKAKHWGVLNLISNKKEMYMLGIIAIVLLLIWGGGLALHLLGGFIYIFLVAAIVMALAHFVTGNSKQLS